ncbi:MAG: helix-turn-helix transcriptional regulator [Chloroflexia bacterium]|nr:helix-turn-helix transcriptional regulator [Chloroflexia bacterium]
MPNTWRDVRREAVDEGRIDERRVAAHRDRLGGEVVAHRLAEIRKGHGLSQQDVAHAMGVTQSRVSRIESGDISRAELSTVAAYVRALGGTVRVVAEFNEGRIVVT